VILRIFAIVGTLVTVLIIGFMAAMYFRASTAPISSVPSVETPYGNIGGETNQMNAVDTARNIVSIDNARQNDLQNQMDRMDEIWGGQ
jgi:hypothetical protein